MMGSCYYIKLGAIGIQETIGRCLPELTAVRTATELERQYNPLDLRTQIFSGEYKPRGLH
jgi:hypothetical protein